MTTGHGRRISVVGLGYVGLPVAVAFARGGIPVTGYDIDESRIRELRDGNDRTLEVPPEDLSSVAMEFTSDPDDLNNADFHIVTVPTPITAARRPDLGPLLAATRTVGGRLKTGDIVVYESTVYPGATEEDCVPLLEAASGMKCGVDFQVGYSPERINPGDKTHRFEGITKVVAAQNAATLEIIAQVYGGVVKAGIHLAPNIPTAEAAKVIENTQRDLNIALMNELAVIFERMNLDTRDVLAAAATKWNFLNFTPGLVGGHCIGVDPYYLTHRAEQVGYNPEVILAGRRINDAMGQWLARESVKRLMKRPTGHRLGVIVLGITFKEDVPDVRNTLVTDLIRELESFGIDVQVHDPMVDADRVAGDYGIRMAPVEDLKPADAVILAVPHRPFRDGGWVMISNFLKNKSGLVVDVRASLDRAATPPGISLWRL